MIQSSMENQNPFLSSLCYYLYERAYYFGNFHLEKR